MDNYSLSDIAAANGGSGFGGGSAWVLIILFALIFGWGGNGFGGNAANAVSQADLQRAIDLNSIQEGQRSLGSDIQRTAYEGIAVTKDAQYNNLANIRDLQGAVNLGFANQQTCCCETNRNIDSVKFDLANYACQIQKTDTENAQKILDAISGNRMADMQNQINQLQLQNAMCGVPRITNMAYGVTPLNWCNANACDCGC